MRVQKKKKKKEKLHSLHSSTHEINKFCLSVSRPVKELNGEVERKKGRNIKKLEYIYIYIRANMNIHALTRGMRNDEKVVEQRPFFHRT